MPYVPPNGSAVELDLTGGYRAPGGASVNLEFDPATSADIRQAGVGDLARVGTPGFRQTPVARAQGSDTSSFGKLDIRRDVPYISPPSIDSTAATGTPEYVRWRRFIDVTGMAESRWPLGDGRVRLLGGYNPPPSVNVILNWLDEPYSVPPAANVILEFGALGSGRILGATLFDQLVFGDHALTQSLGAQPSGIASTLAFGSHNTSLFVDNLRPSGWNSQEFSTPVLTQVAQGISVGGIAPPPQTGSNSDRQIPSPFIDFRIRYLTPDGIAIPRGQISTTHIIAFDIQYIDLAGRGLNPWTTGNARIGYAVRYIESSSIASNIFGSHNVARIQVVVPTGWGSSSISEKHEFDINLQRLLHHSGAQDQAGYGQTTLRNQFENVNPHSWLSSEISFPVAFNLDQHLLVQPYEGTNSDPTQWPNYSPFVENKKRYLGPGGFMSSRFSAIGNWIWNKGAPISPEGVYGTEWGADTFIAFRIRKLSPEGWDQLTTDRYTNVHNGAAVLAPTWTTAGGLGIASLRNLNRGVRHIFPYSGEEVGTAFIAYAVRNLLPKLFYDVPSGFPEVRLNPYPIAPAGIASDKYGAPEVVERFTIIAPKSTNVHSTEWVGQPAVANRNKSLLVFPSDQSLYGKATVFNYITELTVSAGEFTQYGGTVVGRRTREVYPSPLTLEEITRLHRIWNVLPDPPSPQRVEPPSIFIGLATNPGVVPTPHLRLATIYPVWEGSGAKYGAAKVTTNTIQVGRGIFSLDQLGVPMMVATQYVLPRPIPTNPLHGDSDEFPAKPSLSPHTIYAPSSDMATDQAKRNHPEGRLAHRIDGNYPTASGSAGGGWPWFGRVGVTNQHRSVGPVPRHSSGTLALSPSSRIARPAVYLRVRYIHVESMRLLRFGLPVLPFTPQYINLDGRPAGIPPSEVPDTHTVAPPPIYVTPTLRPNGVVPPPFGAAVVELFNRTFSVAGIPHRGNPQQGLTNPWGLPLVGYPREYVWTAGDLSLWGTTWVSHKVRELPTEGWDSLSLIDEDLGSFKYRMRVLRKNPEGALSGIPPTVVFGTPDINFVNRTVLARGIAGYNSGEHRAKTFLSVTVDGWDSLEIGDIDRWEAGLVKAHGDDLSSVGYPRILNPLPAIGIFTEAVGAARVGSGITPLCIPAIGFAGPSVSNPFGCTNRVVTPLPALSQQNVPKPMVSQ